MPAPWRDAQSAGFLGSALVTSWLYNKPLRHRPDRLAIDARDTTCHPPCGKAAAAGGRFHSPTCRSRDLVSMVFGALFLLGYFWPSVATFIEANTALNLGSWLGIFAIILSPFSRKSRSDFRQDFDRSYSRFYIVRPPLQRMNCTIVKQLPNHCVPACLESVAKDSGLTSITQEDIVRQFRTVFPNGVLNDVNKSPNVGDVVRHLGLADEIYRIQFQGIENLAELHQENEILLMWSDPAKHCVRVCGCDPSSQLVTVMDPEQDELQTYDVAQLNSLDCSLVFFKRRH